MGAFLRDIGGKIAGISQCRALGTTLSVSGVVLGCVVKDGSCCPKDGCKLSLMNKDWYNIQMK